MKVKISLISVFFILFWLQGFSTLTTPTLVSPSTGSLNNSPDVLLDWSTVTNATGYEYKLSTDAGLAGASTLTVTGTSQIYTSQLKFGTIYYWQVRAIKTSAPIDSSAWSIIWNFTTTDQITLVSPTSGATNQIPNVILDWSGLTGITYYDYQWDTTATFTSPLNFYSSVAAGSSQITSANLRFGTKYYWRARARHIADTTQWTSTWNFTTTDQLTLVSPANGAINQIPDVILDWSGLTGITYYDYHWDTTATFTSPLNFYSSVASGSSQITSANLRFGTKYYWRARARHTADTTQWTPTWNFTTTDQLTLVSPANGAINQTPDVILDWSALTGITYYDYQWDTVATFTSPLNLYSSVAVGSSQITSANLRFGTKYYWRARARNTVDTTQWTTVWNFITTDQLTLVSPASGAINQTPDVILDWSILTGITYYDYQWDTTATFTSSLNFYSSVAAGSSQITSANLRFGTKYYWRARARHTADTTQWTPTWNFTTTDQITLVSPTSGAINQAPNVILDWSILTGITYYDYQWDTTSTFSSPLNFYGSVAAGSSQITSANLRFGTKYYWRARARHTADTTQWTPIWNFTTYDYLTHVSPANGATGISLNPTIDWNTPVGVTGYQYQYSTDINFTNPSLFTIGTSSSQAGLVNLSYGTTYYWQVRAFHTQDTTLWSTPWSFTTLYQLTTAPSLISPVNSSINIPVTGTTLEWSSVSGATTYEFEYADNSSFTNPVVNTTTGLTSLTGSLLYNTLYYWKVRAGNGSGFSPWSVVWSFTSEFGTGINENSENSKFSIFPNPCMNSFSIQSSDKTLLIKKISIIDLTGRTIYCDKYSNISQIDINVASFENGLYYVIFEEVGSKQVLPIFINH